MLPSKYTSKSTILALERLDEVETYWDMHVFDTHNYVTVDGAIHHNSGKSTVCVMEVINLAMAQPKQHDGIRRARVAVIRNTYPELKDTTLKTWLQWLPEPEFGRWHETSHTYFLTGIPGLEVEVLFRALDRPDHIKHLLSLELSFAWVNEAREVPWEIVQGLGGRIDRYPARRDGGVTHPCIIMDTNPPDDDSWWFNLFEVRRPDNAVLYKQPSGLSPQAENLKNLPDGYYTEMAKTADPEFLKVYVHGQYGFTLDGKPVYPGYNDSLHCVEFEVPRTLDRLYRGWDFGLTPACVLSFMSDGQWRTFHEFTVDDGDSIFFAPFADRVINDTLSQYPQFADKRNRPKLVDIGDPSGNNRTATAQSSEEATCFAVARGRGIDMRGGDQAVSLRLDSVKYALSNLIGEGRPAAIIHPRCTVLRKGYMGRYQYRRMQIGGTTARYHVEPDKNLYSHVHDANQYIAAHLFGHAVKGREDRKAKWGRKIPYRQRSIM